MKKLNQFWDVCKHLLASLFFLLIAMHVQAQVGGWDPDAVSKADETIVSFKEKDPSLQRFFDKAYGYAVFPAIGKGGLGTLGGAHGAGVLYQNANPIGTTTMTQITVGIQLGGQAYSEIIFFEDEETLTSFKEGDIEFSAQVSAVAADKGASANVAYEAGVAVFTMTKAGLMYEASIGGQKFKFKPMEQIEH